MRRLLLHLGVILILAVAFAPAPGQERAHWEDPSPHNVHFITVEDGVDLEVLDWGGAGRAVVLLAGYNTAHIYDDFAPKLTQTNHVYSITRRGFGASSHPESGYSAERSADDVLAVLDALELTAPVLAGNSFGGQDLSTLGALHPNRMAGLIYLNSAEDPTLVWSDYGLPFSVEEHEAILENLPASKRSPSPPDDKSFQAFRNWQIHRMGFGFPESELRQMFLSESDGTMGRPISPGRVRDAIFAGRQKPDYQRIVAPALAFFNLRPSIENQIQKFKPKDDKELRALKHAHAADLAILKRHVQDIRAGIPAARVIELPGGNSFVFLSNEADVLREMRAFLGSLE